MYICNDEKYGYITALLEENATITDDRNNLLNLKLSISGELFIGRAATNFTVSLGNFSFFEDAEMYST